MMTGNDSFLTTVKITRIREPLNNNTPKMLKTSSWTTLHNSVERSTNQYGHAIQRKIKNERSATGKSFLFLLAKF
jgi:hypothetical protein